MPGDTYLLIYVDSLFVSSDDKSSSKYPDYVHSNSGKVSKKKQAQDKIPIEQTYIKELRGQNTTNKRLFCPFS